MFSLQFLLASASVIAVASASPEVQVHARDFTLFPRQVSTFPVSSNAICGAYNGSSTCQGSGFGNCCSQFGYCGSDAVHCGSGCQSAYGTCGIAPAVVSWQYEGCYTDATLSRTLNVSMNIGGNTNERCQAACNAGGYTFAGTEFGSQCFCGYQIFNNPTVVTDGTCNKQCAGNATETCGGPNRLSLYQLVPQWQVMGCYTDSTLTRTLNSSINLGGATIETCQSACGSAGFKYSGVEFGVQCFCGNAIMNGGSQVTDGSCNIACAGNANEICGGSNRLTLSIFQ